MMSQSSNLTDEGAIPSAYKAALEDLGRRRKRLWMVLLGYLPFAVVLHFTASDKIAFLLLAVLVSGFALHASLWRCPKCGERAFYKTFYQNMLSSKCLHCGLELSGSADSKQP